MDRESGEGIVRQGGGSLAGQALVPVGAPDQESGMLDFVPSQVNASGIVPPSSAAVLVSLNAPLDTGSATGVTLAAGDARLFPTALLATTVQL